VGEGGACEGVSGEAACASGLRCDEGVCGKNVVIASGGECDAGNNTRICAPGSACLLEVSGGTISGRCGAPKASGSSCYTALECQPGLTCLGAQGVTAGQCGTPKALGQPCATGQDCASFQCGRESGVCEGLFDGDDEACVIPAGM
jgi:hypothetical protein